MLALWHQCVPCYSAWVPGCCTPARECAYHCVCLCLLWFHQMCVCACFLTFNLSRWVSLETVLNLNIFIANICNNIAKAFFFFFMIHMPLKWIWSNAFSSFNLVIACPCFLTCLAHLQANICIIIFTNMEKAKEETTNIHSVSLICANAYKQRRKREERQIKLNKKQ